MTLAAPPTSPKLEHDLKTLVLFIETFCRNKHAGLERISVRMRTHDVAAVAGHPVELCPECAKLLMHAFVKRSHCPMNPKPQCKHCPNHCYDPKYRYQIRQVMKYSGIRLFLKGRVHYLAHLLS